MTDLDQDMKRLTEGLKTKSDKIRRLGNAGYKRQQIADFLGIRYQHVRNVLVEAEKRAAAIAAPETGFAESNALPPAPPLRRSVTTARVGPDGSVTFPAQILAAAGFSPSDRIIVHVTGDGHLELLSGRQGLKRAQKIVRRSVPKNVDLLAEFLNERQQDFEKEEREHREFLSK